MKNKALDLITYTGVYWNGKLYCLARDYNLLFSVNLQDGKTELIDAIPEEDVLTPLICGIMTVWNNKIIFTPNKTKKIWIYDLVSEQWQNLILKEQDHLIGTGNICQTHIYKNKLFLVGSGYPAILCLDLENNSCKYIKDPYNDIAARHPNPDYLYFWYFGVTLDNALYLASNLDNYVLKFNMDTLAYDWIKIGDDNATYWGMTWDGSNFWLSPRPGGDIIKWDGKNTVKHLPLPDELKQHTDYVWGIIYDGDKIVLSAINHTNTIFIDTANDTLQIQKQQYTMYGQLDNGMVVSQSLDGKLTVKTGDTAHEYNPSIDMEQLKQFYENKGLSVFNSQTLYHEAPVPSLLSLENYLALTQKADPQKTAADGSVGKNIWEAIR